MRHSNVAFGKRRIVPLGLAVILTVTALAWSAPAGADAYAGWCAAMVATPSNEVGPWTRLGEQGRARGTAVPLTFVRADYDVQVLGNLLVGELVLEFRNPTDSELQASYLGRRPRDVRIVSMELVGEDPAEEPLAHLKLTDVGDARRPAKTAARSARSRNASSGGKGVASRPIVIEPQQSIRLRARIEQSLTYREGRYHVLLPAVGGECAPAPGRFEWPDGRSPGAPLSARITIHHDRPLEAADSPTHDLVTVFEGTHTVAEPVTADPLGDRPLHFEFALGERMEPAMTGFVTPEREGGQRDVLLVLAPPVAPPSESVRAKEALFVIDTSGSMNGAKIDQARKAVGSCLEHLADADRFNLVEFDNGFTVMTPEPVGFDAGTLTGALSWLETQQAGGGTRLLPALSATFAQPHEPDYHRLVIVLTDGMVQDESQVVELLKQELGQGRLFFVGIGDNAKRDAIERLAEFGRGVAAFATEPEALEAALRELFSSVSEPVAWDLQLDWGGVQVVETSPSKLPDLYAGRPVTIQARVRGELPEELELTATTMDGEKVFRVVTPRGGAREYEILPKRSTDRRR